MDEKTITVVKMTAGHARQAADISALCFPDPWSPSDFETALGSRTSYFVAALTKDENTVENAVGFGGINIAADEADVVDIAVLPDFRREGIGKKIMTALIEAALARGVKHMYLEVREHNAPAIKLYSSLGFSPVYRRKNYYRTPAEDAVVYSLSL